MLKQEEDHKEAVNEDWKEDLGLTKTESTVPHAKPDPCPLLHPHSEEPQRGQIANGTERGPQQRASAVFLQLLRG